MEQAALKTNYEKPAWTPHSALECDCATQNYRFLNPWHGAAGAGGLGTRN